MADSEPGMHMVGLFYVFHIHNYHKNKNHNKHQGAKIKYYDKLKMFQSPY